MEGLEELAKLFGFSMVDLLSYGATIYFVVEAFKSQFPMVFSPTRPWLKQSIALLFSFGLGIYLYQPAVISIIVFGLLTFAVATGANRAIGKSGGKTKVN